MLSSWPIRTKLTFGVALLLVMVTILAISGFRGVYAYRGLAKTISRRASELPVATELAQQVGSLQVALSHLKGTSFDVPLDKALLRDDFQRHLDAVTETIDKYRNRIDYSGSNHLISDNRDEIETLKQISLTLESVHNLNSDVDWLFRGHAEFDALGEEVDKLASLASTLPTFLQNRMHAFASQVRVRYRTWIAVSGICSLLSAFMLILSMRLFFTWVIAPLRMLIHGSRRVAKGDFHHRIELRTNDEIAELADAMNQMTSRFQEIRDDLDRQVKQRTKQVVRGEQLASVGFLAAGVAHEINNPLASIALCAESLEARLHDIIQQDDAQPDDQHNSEISGLKDYLRMIQDEAFRCKEITEQLLDFSRMGDVEKQDMDLASVIQNVVEMVRHIGKYKEKSIEFSGHERVVAAVNSQEVKQVVLNLITNALDSLNRGGKVKVRLSRAGGFAKLVVQDNGCGMTEEVQEHLFEPFFTRRRDGQGTGLGMSISYRIVTDHGGQIDVHSDGPGKGSIVTVTLPLTKTHKEVENRYQAA